MQTTEPIASSTAILGPFNSNSHLIEERIAALHYREYKDIEAALRFTEQMGQVWPHVATIYADQYTAAYYMMQVLKLKKDARVSAHNLRLAAGQEPKFAKRLKASL